MQYNERIGVLHSMSSRDLSENSTSSWRGMEDAHFKIPKHFLPDGCMHQSYQIFWLGYWNSGYVYIYIAIHITKGSLLAGYLEFYFAKQRGGLDPLSLNDQEKGTPPPLKGNSRHMPGESLHATAPSQCLVIITIIIINIIIIILLITIIIRVEIRIFRHPFSKYPTVRWKWQVRASIGTAKRDIGVCEGRYGLVDKTHPSCVRPGLNTRVQH